MHVSRASTTLRNVRSAWVKEQQVRIENGNITEFQVNLMVTFVLDDTEGAFQGRSPREAYLVKCDAARRPGSVHFD